MLDKRGQELSVGTLILIVLGVVVLILLIMGFSMGWSTLWEKINIFTGGGSSVDSVVEACKISAASGSLYSFCVDLKEVKIAGKKQYITCQSSFVTGVDGAPSCASQKDAFLETCRTVMKSVKAGTVVTINSKDISVEGDCANQFEQLA